MCARAAFRPARDEEKIARFRAASRTSESDADHAARDPTRGGAYKDEGLDIILKSSPRPDDAARSIMERWRAIFRTLRWTHDAGGAEIAAAVAGYFPDIPRDRLTARYQRLGVRGRDPRLPRSGYDQLMASILSAGAATLDLPFEQAVDNSLAQTVMVKLLLALDSVR
jgi:hypothetical protein